MPESRSHAATANRIARNIGTDYNRGPGADIQTDRVVIEVETPDSVGDASRQLRGHKKPVYVAGTNHKAVLLALEVTNGTTIGVMDNQGNIIKPSTRGR